MAGPPSAQDVADALLMTLEREDASGAPWCPPRDGMALRRWVSDRSALLGTGIRRVVRLARLMALADGRDYVRFLYIRLPLLRARHLRYQLEEAAAGGRLPRTIAKLSEAGVLLLEPALATEGTQEPFEIDFAQMPRLAALLDFLHNALGFSVIADLLAPLLSNPPTKTAAEVARSVHATLNAWLSDRLESQNHILQAQRIRAFLVGRGALLPDRIDDEAILAFWEQAAQAKDGGRVDGFRLYRSVARAMLLYRQALRDAATAKLLEESLGRGLEGEGELATDPFDAGGNAEPWRSPLSALVLPPANAVKWLTKKEQNGLLNFLGGPAEEEESAETGGEQDSESSAWKGGLAAEERFDLGFWLTLLRADVFGAVQASIVARLRKRATADAAIAQALSSIDDAAYATCTEGYADLRRQLRLECLAALVALMEAGAAEAVFLIDRLGGPQAVRFIIGDANTPTPAADDRTADAVSKTIAPALKGSIADPTSVSDGTTRGLLLEALAATRKVNRVGFRREDRAHAGMLAALQVSATAVIEVDRELDRLGATLLQQVGRSDIASDRARFLAGFKSIYLASEN
jgi:hypothetical protein